MKRSITFKILVYVVFAVMTIIGRCDESPLLATTNMWGCTSASEYSRSVFTALSGTNDHVVASEELRGWFTNMIICSCPQTSFDEWMREKKFMLDVGVSYAEVAKSLDCWIPVAELYHALKVAKEELNVVADSSVRMAFLTNGNATAYYSALDDEKNRMIRLRTVDYMIPCVSNVVFGIFPAAVLPNMPDELRGEAVSNVINHASMTSPEAAILEAYLSH